MAVMRVLDRNIVKVDLNKKDSFVTDVKKLCPDYEKISNMLSRGSTIEECAIVSSTTPECLKEKIESDYGVKWKEFEKRIKPIFLMNLKSLLWERAQKSDKVLLWMAERYLKGSEWSDAGKPMSIVECFTIAASEYAMKQGQAVGKRKTSVGGSDIDERAKRLGLKIKRTGEKDE